MKGGTKSVWASCKARTLVHLFEGINFGFLAFIVTFGFPAFLVIETILNRTSLHQVLLPRLMQRSSIRRDALTLQAWRRHHAAKAARMIDKFCETSFSTHHTSSFTAFLTKLGLRDATAHVG